MIFVLVSGAGALLGWASEVGMLPAPTPNSMVKQLNAWDAPPEAPFQWSPALADFVVPATSSRRITPQTYMDRVPVAVRLMVYKLAKQDTDVGAQAQDWLTRFLIVPMVDLDDNRTQESTTGVVQLAGALGVVPLADVNSIIADILA